jgi:4-aminobutyrate aminotransferase / (S)-3-amino-2-methylpropionate transaminase / 5-aminovalerate transaminase
VRLDPRDPDPELSGRIARACQARAVVVLTAGRFGNVLCFLPSLVMGLVLLGEGADVVETAFAEHTPAR